MCKAVDVKDDNIQLLIPCLLTLRSVKVSDPAPSASRPSKWTPRIQAYNKSMDSKGASEPNANAPAEAAENSSSVEPTIQGAVLLQSMLRLSEPHNQLVIQRYEY